ncbi:MAG: RsmE family RNA methyltransferase [Planctomycetota bacterium]|jgi:16S rRNA (uracil1498-N3)-methyltransferase
MSTARLFCSEIVEGSVILSAEESHHAISVLRIKPGEEVVLFNGAGRRAIAVVRSVRRRRLEAAVTGITDYPFDLSRNLTLAVAMPKAARQAYLIEKCTELGVSAIWPIATERSVAKPKAGAIERWRRRAVEASKQSRRLWVPTVETPQSFSESIERIPEFDATAFTALEPPGEGLPHLLGRLPDDASLLVCVGPEGGWSHAEREVGISAGAVPVSLGPTVLRTETAAIAVCAAVAVSSTALNTGDVVG